MGHRRGPTDRLSRNSPPAARLTDSALATSPNSYGRPDLPQPAPPTPTVVVDAPELVVAIENVDAAINQIAQTTLRNIVEQHSQDEVLAETSVINGSIREILDTTTVEWDVEVTWSRRRRSAPGDHDRHFVTARLAGFYPATTPAGVG